MFSDINKQITILKTRGLEIENNSFNRSLLMDNNYYNVINGFKEPFLDKSKDIETYKSGTRFLEIFSLYEFDRKLRNLILDFSLKIENSLKTKIAYEFARKYGENTYLETNSYIFDTHEEKNKTINLLSRLIEKINKENSSLIYQHFIDNDKEIPIWAAISFFDFGTIRLLYNCLDDILAFNIANYYNINKKQLISFLSVINMYRNVCAHDNRIMKYIIYKKSFSIANTDVHKNMNLNKDSKNEYIVGKRDLFALIISFKYLLRKNNFELFFIKLTNLFEELKTNLSTITIEYVYNEYNLPLGNSITGEKYWTEILNIPK